MRPAKMSLRSVYRFRQIALSGVAGIAVLTASAASAQDTDVSDGLEAGEAGRGLEEIVVTARKREEGLQDTPISISAFTSEGLESRQVQKISGIASQTPSLTFEEAAPISGNSSVAVMFIRGIGQVESIPTVDLGVGLYVDGVYLARSVGGVLDLVDVERVEILRGPQGTLFGRNTIGGAVSITSKKPEDYLNGEVSLLVGSDNFYVPRAMLNVPLGEGAAVRLSGVYTTRDGYVEKPLTGNDTGDENRFSGRAHLMFEATPSLEFNVIFDYTRERTNGAPYVLSDTAATGLYPLNPDGTPTPFPPDQLAAVFPFFNNIVLNGATCAAAPPPVADPPPLPQCFGDHLISPNLDTDLSDFDSFSNLDIWGVSFTGEWDIGAVTLKSITAYRETEAFFAFDQDHTPLTIAEVDTTSDQWQFTQELQLLGTAFDDRLNYILGGFFFREKAVSIEGVTFPVVDFQSGGRTNNRSVAAFAQATFEATDRLSITGGIRYTKDNKKFEPDQFVNSSLIGVPAGFPLIATIGPGGPVAAPEDELRFSRWTPMFNVSYDLTDDVMTYVTYSEGFKSGGFTQRVFPPVVLGPGQGVGDVLGFAPEIAKVWEVGFKSELLDGSVRLNGALFKTDYSGVQVTVQNVSVAPIILNAASADIKGGELELTAAPLPGALLELGVGYIDAEFNEVAPGAQVTVDDKFIKTPKWTLSSGASYEILTDGAWTITPRVDWAYRSRTENNSINSPQVSQPGYHLLGAGITFDNPDKGLAVVARLDNITDERYITGAFSDDINTGLTEIVLDRGREWSITLRKRF